MNPDNSPLTPLELRQWRADKGYSLARVAGMLDVSSPNTIKTWEDEKVEIPGPAALILRWLIRGEAPFEPQLVSAGLGDRVREDIGAVEMTVDAFEECLRRTREAGFGSVTEWIADLVKHELHGSGDQLAVPETRQEVSYRGKRGRTKPE